MSKLDAIFVKRIGYFEVYKTRNKYYKRRYIIWNTHFNFNNGHTHTFTIGGCESIVQHVLNKTEPVRRSNWKDFNDVLISCIRLSDDDIYINHLINAINNKNKVRECRDYITRRSG